MHPFFIAMGPSFKSDYSVETFNSVDIYPLMCELLGITPAPNNGSLSVVKDLLKDQTVMQQGMPVLACEYYYLFNFILYRNIEHFRFI